MNMEQILHFILFMSDAMIPLLIFVIVGTGVLAKVPVYDHFVKGAEEGIRTAVKILPTLVGLMVAVGVLRASGFLGFVSKLLGGITEWIHFPSEVVPFCIVRLFSSSAATGLALDIFENYGTDSRIGMLTSILMSCSETVFYTLSVYFMTAKIRKTRYTLAGALIASFADIVVSVLLVEYLI